LGAPRPGRRRRRRSRRQGPRQGCADLVLLDWPEGATPAARMTLSNGTIAAMAGEMMR
jgi:hypothetical protein